MRITAHAAAETQSFPTLSKLHISREAMLHNVRLIRSQLPLGTKVCAMVKADAYGHGADLVVDTLCNFEFEGLPSPAVDQLGVATLDEASALPQMLPILVLRPIESFYIAEQREAIESAIAFGWILNVQTVGAVDDLAKLAMRVGRAAKLHVMIDTGMTREGCPPEMLSVLLTRISAYQSLQLVSVGTHFASADEPESAFVAGQFGRFVATIDGTIDKLAPGVLRHVSNSGATFLAPRTHLDMVRPGISLYGIDPTGQPNRNRALRPIAKWTAPILAIQNCPRGTSVGYGQTWTAQRDTRIGLLPIGYADGYVRNLSSKGIVLHGKTPLPVVGRVSMDQITIDLENVPGAQVGDEITLLDNDPLSPVSAYALAQMSGTIPYEVFTRIGPRVKRVAVEQ